METPPPLSVPFVAFVGAGASALPPSCLPTWRGFNTLVLEALCERLATFSRDRQPTDRILESFRSRRDGTQYLTPDFQAQLMEEEVGGEYFRVWQSLQGGAFGPVHAALAELHARGLLAAVITTNFDCLIEAAMKARGLSFQAFHDAAGFAKLTGPGPDRESRESAVLPILKIHGSVEDPESLVDTLRQRLVGRPQALQTALDRLLRRHAWVYLGFSGADFTHAPNYLNVLDSAPEAEGFIFLSRPGEELQVGVKRLLDAYGIGKARAVTAELASWLPSVFGFELPGPVPSAQAAPAMEEKVRAGIAEWAGRLGPIAVVNIVFSMLKTAGLETAAFWLMRKTWKSYRTPEDAHGRSYDRFNYNYGCALREAGFISNPIELAADMGNLMEWKSRADQNAFEYLARSYHSTPRPATGSALACVLAYRGETGRALELIEKALDAAIASRLKTEICDTLIDGAVVWDIIQSFAVPIERLRAGLDIARSIGDEPRRAHLAALLGRFLAYAGRTGEADPFLAEALELADRFDLLPARHAALAARGIWHAEAGRPADAIAVLDPLADAMRLGDEEPLFAHTDLGQAGMPETQVKGTHPLRVRVLLDLNRAALLAGRADLMNGTLDELDVLATHFAGYCPQYYFAYIQCLIEHGDGNQSALIDSLVEGLERIDAQAGNPWIKDAVARIRRVVPKPPAAAPIAGAEHDGPA